MDDSQPAAGRMYGGRLSMHVKCREASWRDAILDGRRVVVADSGLAQSEQIEKSCNDVVNTAGFVSS